MGIPLGVARGARLPGSAWSKRDWALAQAVEVLDRNRCGGCGQPTWLSHDLKHKRSFKATVETCFSCSAIATRQSEMATAINPSALKYSSALID